MLFSALFGELGGVGYDACAGFATKDGVTPMGCDEFFPPPQVRTACAVARIRLHCMRVRNGHG
jgi:hypothetical protein